MNLQSEQIDLITQAIVKVQSELKRAKLDAKNPFLKNSYASLESVVECSRKLLTDNGIAIIQTPIQSDVGIGLKTILSHVSGQWIAGELHLPIGIEKGKSVAQVVGSLISYARRYSISSMVGILTGEDDDGNMGSDPRQQQPQQQQPQQVDQTLYNKAMKFLLDMRAPEQWAKGCINYYLQQKNGDINEVVKEMYNFFNANYFFDPKSQQLVQKL